MENLRTKLSNLIRGFFNFVVKDGGDESEEDLISPEKFLTS